MSIAIVLIPIAIASIGTGSLIFEKNDKKIIINTKMKDEDILKEAMIKYGYDCEKNRLNLKVFTENGQAFFRLNHDNLFQAVFNKNFSKDEAKTIVDHIFEEYTLLVQEKTYEKVIENLDNYNFKLESEQITDKNSIVLTLELQ